MGKEYEAKFLEINIDEMREKLKNIGASQVHKNMRYVRTAYNLCGDDKGFARVRAEGDKVTMTAKIYKDPKFP